MSIHEIQFPLSNSEDISSHIDRLNQALEGVMKEIEASSCSRNPSRLSVNINSDFITENNSEDSEHNHILYDSTIESLLQTIDRQQMTIEDLFSEEKRRASHPEPRERTCNHDLNRIRKEVWLQVKMQKNEQNEKERKRFEEKLEELDELQADYVYKRKELVNGIETLKVKEKLLSEKEKIINEKEKEIRNQRLNMDKMKIDLEFEKFKDGGHSRRSSLSCLPCIMDFNVGKEVEEKKLDLGCSKQEQLKNLHNEIRLLESYKSTCKAEEIYEIDVKIESLKGKVAGLRGEIAISESSKTTKLMNTMMLTIQNEVNREERSKRMELVQAANKNLLFSKPQRPTPDPKPETTPKQVKVIEYGAPVPKGFIEPTKSKVSSLKEFCSQANIIKLPGAKELIENVSLTLSTLNSERMMFDREKEDFNKEKIEWIRNKERTHAKNRIV